MSALFYRNTRLLLLTLILIVVWGVSSFLSLPRLEDPVLVSRAAIIKTFFPGANAERVEALVTEKIEEELAEIEELKTYESTSRAGSSIIRLELFDWVGAQEVDGIWSRIRDQVEDVAPTLPAGATEPEFDRVKIKAYALLTALTWTQDDQPNYAILGRLAENLKDELNAIAGTEEVEEFGAPQEEIVVEIDPVDLTTRNLTAQDLSQQIQQSDSKVAAGQVRSDRGEFPIEVAGELDTLDRIRQIPIRFGQNSQSARLGDIAQVRKGIANPPSDLALIDGRPGITLGVFVESDRRIDRWAKEANKTLEKFRQQLPRGVELEVIFDQNRYVTNRLATLISNLLLGAALVFAVTLWMMGWQSALIVGSALPLSVLMVFGCMQALNIPLHQMSITGLIVALGILIDNGIVVVDEVQNQLRQGCRPIAAIQNSVRYLAIPLLSSTLTTVFAFMPIALLPGPVGEFVGTIGLSVIVAVTCSLFLALTIIPTLTVRLNRYWQRRRGSSDRDNQAASWWQTGFSHPALARVYRWSLQQVTARPVWGIVLALVLPVVGFVQAGSLEQQFFPAADRDQLQIELELPASTAIAQTQSVVKEARTLLLRHPQVQAVHWFIGESAPRFYYNLSGSREQQSNYAQAIVQLNQLSTSQLTQTLQAQMDRDFPDATVLVRQLEQGPPFDAPIEMRLYGSDLDRLQGLGEQMRSQLAQIESVTHTRDSLSEVRAQLQLQVDEDEARLAGLDRRAIAQQLETTLEGSLGGSIIEGTEELPVRVRLSNVGRGDLDQIAALDLLPTTPSEDGTRTVNSIPLSTLGEMELNPELAAIVRRNGRRVNIVQGYIAAGVLPAEVLAQFKSQLAASQFQLPPGYSYEFGGEAEERSSAIGGLVSSLGVLTVLMVATLVLSLGSFRLAALIGVVAVCSFGLGLFSIWLFGYPFGFNPIIGTVGLIGVAINDSIVVLAALQADPIARSGDRQAVREVVFGSTRHVIATTLTTMIGFVPLLLSGGEFWPPLAVAIAGGVGGATLLALYFIPAAYLLLAQGKTKIRRSSQQRLGTLAQQEH